MISKDVCCVKLAVVILIFLVTGAVHAQSEPANPNSYDPDQWAIGLNYIRAKDMKSWGLYEFTLIDYNRDSSIEYSFAPYVLVSFAKVDGRERYSFKSPVNLALLGLDALTTRYLLGLRISPVKSPLRYFLFAPNSAVNLCLHRGLKFTVATNTEFVFFRLHDGERGILFTPQVGFTLSGGPDVDEFNGVIFTLGATRFWSFDGADKPFQIAFRIGFLITDLPGSM